MMTALVMVTLRAGSACATDLYVDGRHGNDFNSGTLTGAFATVDRAVARARPGDTIHVMPTTTYASPFYLSKSGTASAPITIRGEGTGFNMTKVVVLNNFAIHVPAGYSYINIENFDASAPGNWSAVYVSPGATHISISGNRTHDSGGSGINTVGADYVSVVGNVVYNNSFNTSTACGSGIEIYQLRNSDTLTTYKNTIMNNVLYGNSNTPGGLCADSDGSGIIIDDARNTQHGSIYGAYVGGTLIANNVAFNNGGRGIEVFESDNVLITNNTLYENNKDPNGGPWEPGEITLLNSGSIQVFNNILYSDGLVNNYFYHTAFSALSCDGGPIEANNNIMYNPQGNIANALYLPISGSHANSNSFSVAPWNSGNLWADPRFKNPSTSSETADFELLQGTPAQGLANRSYTPSFDLLGPMAGAYEIPVN